MKHAAPVDGPCTTRRRRDNRGVATMNILLIAPATGDWRRVGRRRTINGKTFRFSMLSLLSVAALSPKDAQLTLVDEQVEDIPDGPFDLVGITAMTDDAPRAYELCDRFRAQGIPVVMGGFHASLNPDEALTHANAVVVGPAYGAWERLCADVAANNLQRIYRGDPEPSIPVHLPRHLLQKGRYVTVGATFATLGCRNRCRFCSIHPFYDGRRILRPVEDVVAELGAIPDRFFVFVDDNLTQDRDYALALFRALAPLRKRWATQASLDVTEDPEMLSAMRDAGCLGLFIGLETFNRQALEDQDKGFNTAQRYRDAVATVHRHGMYVEAGMMVGFDTDGVEVFQDTLRMLQQARIDAIQLSVFTPLPGTEAHRSMMTRIFDPNLEHYDYRHAVFSPARMTAQELQSGADWLIRSFYAPWRILARIPRWLGYRRDFVGVLYPLGLNLAYWGRVLRFGIRGSNPASTENRYPEQARIHRKTEGTRVTD